MFVPKYKSHDHEDRGPELSLSSIRLAGVRAVSCTGRAEWEREVRVLEKLDERQRQKHNQNEHRREVRQMDEIAARVTQNK